MEVEVKNAQRKYGVDRPRLVRLAERALERLGLGDAQLSVLIVNDRRIRDLNRQFRGIDSPTDVLAFSQREGPGDTLHSKVLGDVVISAESATRQSSRYRRTPERELDFLLVHGILHLAGFNHGDTAGAGRSMDVWKRKILRGWEG